MTYTTKITSKGTTTIPVEIRRKLNLTEGSYLRFDEDRQSGDITLRRTPTIKEIQAESQELLRQGKLKPLSDRELKAAIETARITGWTERERQSHAS